MPTVSLETLAALAGQGGASDELDAIHFAENTNSSVPARVLVSEHVNAPEDDESGS